MSEIIYLFKRAADGVWIFGPNADCEHSAGACRVVPNTARTKVDIIYLHKSEANQNKSDIPFGNFLNEAGTAYASFAALKAGYAGFFAGGSISGSLALPTGAATSVKQSDGTQKTQTVDVSGVATESRFRVLKQLVTRPANTTPVIANGVLTDVSGLISSFINACKAAGYGLMITDLRIQTNDTGIAGKTLRIHLYDDVVTPTTYNNAFALDDANAGKRRGKIEAVFAATGNLTKVASNLTDAIIINPVGTIVPFKLECVEGYTPSANSTWFEVELGVVQTN